MVSQCPTFSSRKEEGGSSCEGGESKAPSRRLAQTRPARWTKAILLPLAAAGMVAGSMFLAGCSSTGKSSADAAAASNAGPVHYIVTADETSFFKYGPAQAGGADLKLKKGETVVMLDRHYGFSRVALGEGGEAGYVPTEDINPLPNEPVLATASTARKKSGGGSTGGRGVDRVPDFAQPNDAALPSTQTPSDTPVPSFRY